MRYADPTEPLVWVRGDRGCVGVGEVLRLTFSGPDRFTDAARAWRDIADAAVIDDPVRMPGTGLLAFGTFAFDDTSRTESVLIVPRLLIAQHRGVAWITEVSIGAAAEPALPGPTEQTAPDWAGTTLPVHTPDAAYLSGVHEATARIDRGFAEKIVLARRLRGTIDADADLRVPLGRLADRYDDCWTFAVDGLIGASPETLIRQTDGAISARVLAGTRGRKPADPAADARARDDLLTSDKEQHEHAFAVQSVITALAPHVHDMRTSEEPFALQLPNVWHLATDLGATPRYADELGSAPTQAGPAAQHSNGTSLELAAALHPTAAVAGTPTVDAVAAIAELEPFDRERYAGPVGWVDARGDGEWVIALRCAQIGAPGATGTPSAGRRPVTAFAGGGIVTGSDPTHEFTETVSKFAPIATAFAP